MRKLRVLVLMHADLVPPASLDGFTDQQINDWKTEYDVVSTLEDMGHEPVSLGIRDELAPIRKTAKQHRSHILFNLLEEFRGEALLDQNVVGYLELLRIPFTGCNSRGLLLARDKGLSKKLLSYHRIAVPKFQVFGQGSRVKRQRKLEFPLIVKSLEEDASLGISQASVVHDDGKLAERVAFVHESLQTSAIVEQFIPGRDIYVGVLGNNRLQVLPAQELVFQKNPDAQNIATAKAKHDLKYQEKWGIDIKSANLDDALARRLEKLCKRIYKILEMSGYARFDFRIDEQNDFYFLEANPNPDLARYEELASAAETAGISYEQLIQRILNAGMQQLGRTS